MVTVGDREVTAGGMEEPAFQSGALWQTLDPLPIGTGSAVLKCHLAGCEETASEETKNPAREGHRIRPLSGA